MPLRIKKAFSVTARPAAAILGARKLSQYDGGKRIPATVAAMSDAIRWAEEILKEIDRRWPQ